MMIRADIPRLLASETMTIYDVGLEFLMPSEYAIITWLWFRPPCGPSCLQFLDDLPVAYVSI